MDEAMKTFGKPLFFPLAWLLTMVSIGCPQVGAQPLDRTPLVGTDEFEVTVQDVKNYLRVLPRRYAERFEWGSSLRVNKAIIDLYALRSMAQEAKKAGVLASVEANWLRDYLWDMEAATVLMDAHVREKMAMVDWEQLALEHYLTHRKDYQSPETVTIRTLLLKVGERSYAEAWDLAESILKPELSEDDFRLLVETWTEDTVARENGGLMEQLSRGKTVPAFEAAAFGLSYPGQVSRPIATQFGVHLIQLLERQPSRALTFEEVKEDIIRALKPEHERMLKEGFREIARTAEPEGFFINESNIADLMTKVED